MLPLRLLLHFLNTYNLTRQKHSRPRPRRHCRFVRCTRHCPLSCFATTWVQHLCSFQPDHQSIPPTETEILRNTFDQYFSTDNCTFLYYSALDYGNIVVTWSLDITFHAIECGVPTCPGYGTSCPL